MHTYSYILSTLKIFLLGILVYNVMMYEFFTDQLTISSTPESLKIAKGKTAVFAAMASGISTNENNFIYQWRKRNNTLSEKVLGINESVLTIPDVLKSDEGLYYCIVTNEWGRSVESNDANLTVFGM